MPGIHVFLVTLETRHDRDKPGHDDRNLTRRQDSSNYSFRSFFTLPDAICARCCSVIGSASSHFRPGSFFT